MIPVVRNRRQTATTREVLVRSEYWWKLSFEYWWKLSDDHSVLSAGVLMTTGLLMRATLAIVLMLCHITKTRTAVLVWQNWASFQSKQ